MRKSTPKAKASTTSRAAPQSELRGCRQHIEAVIPHSEPADRHGEAPRKALPLESPEKDISPELPVVETGTQAAVAASILHGAHIVRVHDVANTVATVKIMDAICGVR